MIACQHINRPMFFGCRSLEHITETFPRQRALAGTGSGRRGFNAPTARLSDLSGLVCESSHSLSVFGEKGGVAKAAEAPGGLTVLLLAAVTPSSASVSQMMTKNEFYCGQIYGESADAMFVVP